MILRKMKCIIFFIQAVLICQPACANDLYSNFAELAANNRENVDFRITVTERGNDVTIVAPHGGRIEPGTSEIASKIAGHDFNLYLFEGIRQARNFDLHITSKNFDEPRAVKMMRESIAGISIHGFKSDSIESVCIGGLNDRLGLAIGVALEKADFRVEQPCRKYGGSSKNNIVNLPQKSGVQLEIPFGLRKKLLNNPKMLEEFSAAIRSALVSSNF